MPQRLAAALATIAFAVCLMVGALEARNSFSTIVWRALVAMFGTFPVGLLLGWMGQRMLDENLRAEEEKLKKAQDPQVDDR